MSVRLNRVVTTLNIGLETIQAFLSGKPELGPVGSLTLNSKITEEQFEALAKEYSRDAAIKKQANSVFAKIKERKEKKAKGEVEQHSPKGVKIIGKIDLDSLNLKTRPVNNTKAERKQKVDDNTYWLTMKGIEYLMNKYKVDLYCNDLILNKIIPMGMLDCFCISTNTGRYEI